MKKNTEGAGENVESDDPEFCRLTENYIIHTGNKVNAIDQALDRGDFEAVAHIGHQLKGSGGSFGFPKISQIGEILEKAARSGDSEAVRAGMAQLRSFLDERAV